MAETTDTAIEMADATPEESNEDKKEIKENTEMQTENVDGIAAPEVEDVAKTEEELEQELKETQITIPRYAPHIVPEWQREQMKGKENCSLE